MFQAEAQKFFKKSKGRRSFLSLFNQQKPGDSERESKKRNQKGVVRAMAMTRPREVVIFSRP
jgi:hypothetical protein